MSKNIFVISQAEIVNTIGGAITVFVEFCNALANKGYNVTGLCFADENNRPKNLAENVAFQNLKYYNNSSSLSEGINAYIEQNRPDLMVFFFSFLYIDANLKPDFDDIPRILMFHSRPDIYNIWYKQDENLKLHYKNTVSQILFPSYFDLLPEYIRKDKVICIPNGINIPEKHIDKDVEHKKIVYLSRVDKYKGLEFLINSFAIVARKYPDWSLDIYGQVKPPEYIDELQKRIQKKNLEKQVFFKGVTSSPKDTLLNYDFCVFPSYFEGFTLGLCDALCVGLPSIGLKACTGVNELIINGKNGFLSDFKEKDFADNIIKLIKNKNLRKKMSDQAIESCRKYDKNIVWQLWFDLLEDIFDNKNELRASINKNSRNKTKYRAFSVRQILKLTSGNKPKRFFKIERLTDRTKIYIFGIRFSIKIKKKGK